MTRQKVAVVSGTEEERRDILLEHMSLEALDGGSVGGPGRPRFDAQSYLSGEDARGSA